jgi:Na+-driven multidrug efflux pump
MLEMATWVVFFAFYFVSLPLAYYLAFPYKMQVMGLWYGIVGGSISEVILYFLFLKFVCNLDKIAVKIAD